MPLSQVGRVGGSNMRAEEGPASRAGGAAGRKRGGAGRQGQRSDSLPASRPPHRGLSLGPPRVDDRTLHRDDG